MDWWSEVTAASGAFLDTHGLIAAFVFLLIEEAGVPVPIPGDFLMLLLGVRARIGTVSLWQAIVVMEAATIVGASFLYFVSARAGRGLVYRYGPVLRLTPERLDRAEQWLRRHGILAVFLGRLIPGLRIVTAVGCGVFGIPSRVFLPAMSVGALLYIVAYTLVGYLFGPPVLHFLDRLHLPLGLFGSLLPLVVLLVVIVRARSDLADRRFRFGQPDRHRRLVAGLQAGGLATIGSTLFVNVLVNVAGNLAFQAPGTLVERTAAQLAFTLALDLQPLLLFVAAPAYLAVGILWGGLYAARVEPHLRLDDWERGVLFAAIPLAVSLVIVMPVLGLGYFGVGATGAVAAAGEMLRHLAYGALLGLSYPVLLYRRPVRLLPHTDEDETADEPQRPSRAAPTA